MDIASSAGSGDDSIADCVGSGDGGNVSDRGIAHPPIAKPATIKLALPMMILVFITFTSLRCRLIHRHWQNGSGLERVSLRFLVLVKLPELAGRTEYHYWPVWIVTNTRIEQCLAR